MEECYFYRKIFIIFFYQHPKLWINSLFSWTSYVKVVNIFLFVFILKVRIFIVLTITLNFLSIIKKVFNFFPNTTTPLIFLIKTNCPLISFIYILKSYN